MSPRRHDLEQLEALTTRAHALMLHMERQLSTALAAYRRSRTSAPPHKAPKPDTAPIDGESALAASDTPTRSERQYPESAEVD